MWGVTAGRDVTNNIPQHSPTPRSPTFCTFVLPPPDPCSPVLQIFRQTRVPRYIFDLSHSLALRIIPTAQA